MCEGARGVWGARAQGAKGTGGFGQAWLTCSVLLAKQHAGITG